MIENVRLMRPLRSPPQFFSCFFLNKNIILNIPAVRQSHEPSPSICHPHSFLKELGRIKKFEDNQKINLVFLEELPFCTCMLSPAFCHDWKHLWKSSAGIALRLRKFVLP
jgi:hypothetical protein